MTNRDRAAYVARVTTHDEFIVPRREMLYRKKTSPRISENAKRNIRRDTWPLSVLHRGECRARCVDSCTFLQRAVS